MCFVLEVSARIRLEIFSDVRKVWWFVYHIYLCRGWIFDKGE